MNHTGVRYSLLYYGLLLVLNITASIQYLCPAWHSRALPCWTNQLVSSSYLQ